MQLGNSRQKGKDSRGEETGDLEGEHMFRWYQDPSVERAGHSACEQGPLSCARRKNDLKMGDVEKDWEVFVQKCAQCRTVEKRGKHKTGPNFHVHLSERQFRRLDSVTPVPAGTRASPGERRR